MASNRFIGLFATMLFILAVMVFWNFLIRAYVGRNPDSAVARGLAFNV